MRYSKINNATKKLAYFDYVNGKKVMDILNEYNISCGSLYNYIHDIESNIQNGGKSNITNDSKINTRTNIQNGGKTDIKNTGNINIVNIDSAFQELNEIKNV